MTLLCGVEKPQSRQHQGRTEWVWMQANSTVGQSHPRWEMCFCLGIRLPNDAMAWLDQRISPDIGKCSNSSHRSFDQSW